MLKEFPIELPDAPGWFFRYKEVANTCYQIDGRDYYGHQVGRTEYGDLDELLKQCAADAVSITRTITH